jgi:hypothetical protein
MAGKRMDGSPALATIPLIEKVRKVQYHLQCERSMNEVEVQLRTVQHRDTLLRSAIDFFNAQRRHFLQAHLFLLLSAGGALPAWYPAFHANPAVAPRAEVDSGGAFNLQTARHLIDGFAGPPALDRALADLLTFLLPDRFCSFVVAPSCAAIVALIRGVPRATGDLFGRAIFASPGFVTFSTAVFRPILSSCSRKDYGGLRSAIAERWQAHVNCVPLVVKLFLSPPSRSQSRFDPVHALSACFFDVALSPDGARFFGLTELWMDMSDALVRVLRGLLTEGGEESLLPALVAAVQGAEPSPDLTLTKDDIEEIPSLFSPFLVSELDRAAYAGLKGNRLEPVDCYTVTRMWDEGGVVRDGDIDEIGKTMAQSSPAAWIRHLLQRADPIPEFRTVPAAMTVDDFFRQYIVKRGPPQTAHERALNYSLVTARFNGVVTVENVLGPLRGATIERKKELRTLSRFSKISRVYARVLAETAQARELAEKAVLWASLERWFCSQGRQRAQDSLANPASLAARHQQMMEALQAGGEGVPRLYRPGRFDAEIVYSYLTADLAFSQFQKVRTDLKVLDTVITTTIETTRADRIRKQFIVKENRSPSQAREAKWLEETVLGLPGSADGAAVVARVQSAFVQQHPLRMLLELCEGIGALKALLAKRAKPGNVLGPDQFQPSTIALILMVAPASFVSVYVFLHDFCTPYDFLAETVQQVVPMFSWMILDIIGDQEFDLTSRCRWQ